MSYTVLYWVHEDGIALGDKNPLGETGGKNLINDLPCWPLSSRPGGVRDARSQPAHPNCSLTLYHVTHNLDEDAEKPFSRRFHSTTASARR